MADNTVLNLGAGGVTLRTEDIGGIQHELVKLLFGGAGVATKVSAADPLPTTDAAVLAKLSADPATQTTLAAILAKIIAAPSTEAKQDAANTLLTTISGKDFATQTTLAAILAKIIASPATEATLVAILAKVIAAPSTESKQDAANTILTSISNEDFATQTTLAAILTKIIAAPATETKQSDGSQKTQLVDAGGEVATVTGGKLDVNASIDTTDLSTELTLAAILAKIIASPATEAKQDTGNSSLSTIAAKDFATQVTSAAILAKLSADPATQTTVAAILAKIIAAPSTEAKQDTIITALATLLTVTDFDSKTGALTETAPATDIASSGVNGRLQRIAQRITSLITALGSPFQAGGSIGNTSFASTIADAANVVEGALADAIVAAGATGSISAKLRRATQGLEDLKSLIVLAAGTNLIGKVGIDQTTDGTTNKVRAAATQKPAIAATVVMTVTNLQSLASSATVGWQSARVSNLATLATDYEIFIKLTTANTAPGSDKIAYAWICPWYTTDAGTTWFAASQGTATLPTGTEGASTIASPHNLRLLGILNYTTQQMVLQDVFLLSNCFGNRLPDGFSIIITNFTGAALSTGCVVDYSPLNDILV